MKQNIILKKLRTAFTELEETIAHFPEHDFFKKPTENKWSAAENVEHLFLSVKPLAGLLGNTEVMIAKWGRSNRSSVSYEAVVLSYNEQISGKTIVAPLYAPENTISDQKEYLANIIGINNKLLVKASLLTETELDMYQAQHPVLGLLTSRELLYFTHHHTVWHHKTIRQIGNLCAK
jgi:hypothetical protein